MNENNQIFDITQSSGRQQAVSLLAQTQYPSDFQFLLLIDYYLNQKLKTFDDFKEYIQSYHVKKEYKKIESEANPEKSYDELPDEQIRNLMEIKDYHGAGVLIDEKLRIRPSSGYLRVLKIITSLNGKNPAVFPCNEIKAILDSLSCLAKNQQCGILAAAVHNSIVLIMKKIHGIKFSFVCVHENDFRSMDDTTRSILSHLNVPKSIVDEALTLSGGYKS